MEKKKFYELTIEERLAQVAGQAGLTPEEIAALGGEAGLSLEQADHMIENVVGRYALPLGIAQNFMVNGRAVLVPMVIEEAFGGGRRFLYGQTGRGRRRLHCSTTAPEMIGQMQVLDVTDLPGCPPETAGEQSPPAAGCG